MTSAPWWLVLVTVPITGVITLSGVWLTARFNLRGRREDQQHSAALEREKELYNHRVDLYFELGPVIDKIMRTVLKFGLQFEVDSEQRRELASEEREPLTALLDNVNQLLLKAQIISGSAVRGTLDEFVWEYQKVLSRNRFSFGELALQANCLVRDIRVEVGVNSFGALEELPYEDVYGLGNVRPWRR